MTVPDRRTTRRQALGLGAAAFAAASALRSPASALAARPALFELDLGAEPLSASAAGRRLAHHARAARAAPLRPRRPALGARQPRRGAGPGAPPRRRAGPAGRRCTCWATTVPTASAPLAGTDPAFVGAADELQLRLRGNPRALRARFVRALPTATVARRVGERLRRRARALRARARSPARPCA